MFIVSSGRDYHPRELRPNPINSEIYGDEKADPVLIESLKQKGQIESVIIKEDKTIVSGHRRWLALRAMGANVVYDPINVTCSCPVNIPIVNDENKIVETVVTNIKNIPDKKKILRDKCEKATAHGKIKPGEKGTFVLNVQKSNVTASFTFKGTATYSRKTSDGKKITQSNATISGDYEGCNTHNTDAHQEGDELKIAITHQNLVHKA